MIPYQFLTGYLLIFLSELVHNFLSSTHYRPIFGFPALGDEHISCFPTFSQIFFRISYFDWRANFFEYSSIFEVKIDQISTIFDQATSVPGRFQFLVLQFHLCFSSSRSPRSCRTIFSNCTLSSTVGVC